MSELVHPLQVVEDLRRGISDERWDERDGFSAEDAVVEYPLALPAPLRLDGRDAIRRYFAREQEPARNARRRLDIIRYAQEVAGNVAKTCRYYGINRHPYYKWLRRYEEDGLDIPHGVDRHLDVDEIPAQSQ